MEESDNLIVDDSNTRSQSNGLSKKHKIIIGLLIVLLLIIILVIIISVTASSSKSSFTSSTKKHPNIIFLIGDGMGPQITSLARIYTKYIRETDLNLTDDLASDSDPDDYILYHNDPLDGVASHDCSISFTTTYSASSVVTDSAASATALSSGTKTVNGYVGITPAQDPVGTIIEAAGRKGYAGGIVCTSRITHATPAGFTAHVNDRNNEDLIALQQATMQKYVSVYIGGGANKFNGSVREDGRDLFEEAKERGFEVVTSYEQLKKVEGNKSVKKLLATLTPEHFPYELERDPEMLPSLDQNVETAWNILSRNNKPFFMMVEGSLIDFCGHNNDPAAGVKETLSFFKAVDKALELAKKDKNTLVFVVADHDTGGISLSGGFESVVSINFEALRKASLSVPTIQDLIYEKASVSKDKTEIYEYVRDLLIDSQGFDEGYDKAEYIDPIVEASADKDALLAPVTAAIADNDGITYGTFQHTATNILFYSCLGHWKGTPKKKISIKLDTAEIPKWIGEQFGFDFEKATEEDRELYTEVEMVRRDGVVGDIKAKCLDRFHC